jgi:hypothetical protein
VPEHVPPRLSEVTGPLKKAVDRCVKNIRTLDPKMTREKCIEIMEAAIEGRDRRQQAQDRQDAERQPYAGQ